MNESAYYKFKLPNRDNPEDLADVNIISSNFSLADSILRDQQGQIYRKVDGEKTDIISEESTDEEIPSAKAVYDALGNIEIDVDDSMSSQSENPVQNKVISQNVAGSLKGSAIGNPIRLDNVSPLEHEIAVKTSEGGATITKYGKNLFNALDYTQPPYTKPEIIEITENSIKGNFAYGHWLVYSFSGLVPNIDYTFSFKTRNDSATLNWVNGTNYSYSTTRNVKTNNDGTFTISFGSTDSSNFLYFDIYDIQLEYGTKTTEFEPFVEPTTHTADENGNVDGIIGNGKTVTLIAESGVTISAEYNRDINKAFAELQNAIISLGGAI
jgi:hypothetical protein